MTCDKILRKSFVLGVVVPFKGLYQLDVFCLKFRGGGLYG
jgi:hypothetical protein